MLELLRENPLLLLFLVAALGYLIGQIRLGSFSLGVSAVLFVGLAFGALSPELRLPDFVYLFGLVLFVYTIALASGPGFFASFGKRGLRYNLLVAGVIGVAAMTITAVGTLLSLNGALKAGLFAGALTNTPALAAALEALKGRGVAEAVQGLPVAAYAVAYPVGVIGMLLAFHIAWRWWGNREKTQMAEAEGLVTQTVEVTQPRVVGWTIEQLTRAHRWRVVFGRLQRDGKQQVMTPDTELQLGDRLNVVGTADELKRVVETLGVAVPERLEEDRHALDFRRVFVSNRAVAGRSLAELELPQRFGVVITRVRRGEVEFLPDKETILELGDRVRVVGPKDRIREVSRYLGDSYRALAEVDVVSFSLGIALGLLLGSLPIPLPGGQTFELGFAGGPLVVGLLLGALGRTGPILWQIPFSANLTLRQLGLILFLAGIGTRSGYAFVQTLTQGDGLKLFFIGAAITLGVALLTLWIGYRWLKIPLDVLGGVLAGLQTQPAVLAFALEKTRNDRPNLGYATVYPFAMLLKILLVQLLLLSN
ncbi:MAG: aspartate:alanine exchanger family transporter [Meiothermus ruber]|jgi:putative transport protein|uniref:aspartate:alanine exchanger family transporter n=1 Tax=Meiothermus ruber TaxID=277 RepID=UPI0039189859|nr:hypothetical protein [Meiothermus ruber]